MKKESEAKAGSASPKPFAVAVNGTLIAIQTVPQKEVFAFDVEEESIQTVCDRLNTAHDAAVKEAVAKAVAEEREAIAAEVKELGHSDRCGFEICDVDCPVSLAAAIRARGK